MVEPKDPQVAKLVEEFQQQMEMRRRAQEALVARLAYDRTVQYLIRRLEARRMRRSTAKSLCRRLRDELKRHWVVAPEAKPKEEILLEKDSYYFVADNGEVKDLANQEEMKEEGQ